ncbi:MAG TPA: UvrB/UvrC motif-containing protein [Candidatus Hydrogenedens sp.]|nr:UvrB/UvrC motif-containing protein [Candidatus Hydrogenedens sp.]HOL18903.1 UvrB/UvrC motif-containing protein [Candidatus Hydrogenedens sp.]HPP57597.1 UvrB/UvrC motif-containing protein [Candidatus Hydrogenedens sp.]
MICQKCKKKLATVRYAEVIDGHVTEIHLCPDCLIEVQNNPKGFKLSSEEPQVKEPKETIEDISKKAKVKSICSVCGTQLNYIQEKNKVGCFTCYKNFGPEIESILEVIQGGGTHIGKKLNYSNDEERVRAQFLLDTKKALIRQAIKAEDYEFAAKLRDEIIDLEKTISSWKMGKN